MNNKAEPLVSILMTVYNHDKFLHSSIKSIINQTYKNWELIVIDNGSTDKTKQILKNIKNKKIKKFFLKKNIGRTRCLNLGLKICKGKFIAINDSDDLAKKNRLELQIKKFNELRNVDLIGSNYKFLNNKNKNLKNVLINSKVNKDPKIILFQNLIAHSTIMFKKELLKKIGNYSNKIKYAQDYLFILKTLKNGKIFILKNNLMKIRINHTFSESYRLKKTKLIHLEEIKILYWVLKNFKINLKKKFLIYFIVFQKVLNYLF